MKKKHLFTAWGMLYALCAFMGLVRPESGSVRGFFTFMSVVFFVPPFVLLYRAKKQGDEPLRLLLRNLAALSLGLTALLLVCNFLSVLAGPTLGNILHWILTVVSTPMICSGYWALSIFLWACILVAALKK